MSQLSHWYDYPMGPNVRAFLGIPLDSYTGDHAPVASKERFQEFSTFFVDQLSERKPETTEQFIDLLEELTSMGLSGAAVQLADLNGEHAIDGDFRACLALGSSLMLESELEEAILLLRQAQGIAPMELAPYVNLANIYFSLEQDDEAILWAERGLGVDANHPKLWELIASIYLYADKATAGERVRQLADKHGSYSGLSLAAELIDANDPLLKTQLLGDAFNSGIREDEFLIEYTAVLGMAQQFEKIPQILWRLEHMEKKKDIHWKLYAHAAQAFLALNQEEQAQEVIRKAAKNPNIPPRIIEDLQRIYDQDVVQNKA